MTRKIPTIKVDKASYRNYWKKSGEFRETMRHGVVAGNWNAAALNAIHAGISANDAVLACFFGVHSGSPKHDDAVVLLRAQIPDERSTVAARHLTRLISIKNLISYEDRLATQSEALALVSHAERFLEWAESLLPGT